MREGRRYWFIARPARAHLGGDDVGAQRARQRERVLVRQLVGEALLHQRRHPAEDAAAEPPHRRRLLRGELRWKRRGGRGLAALVLEHGRGLAEGHRRRGCHHASMYEVVCGCAEVKILRHKSRSGGVSVEQKEVHGGVIQTRILSAARAFVVWVLKHEVSQRHAAVERSLELRVATRARADEQAAGAAAAHALRHTQAVIHVP